MSTMIEESDKEPAAPDSPEEQRRVIRHSHTASDSIRNSMEDVVSRPSEELGLSEQCCWIFANLVNSKYFDGFICFIVVLNVLLVGAQTDYVARHINEDLPPAFRTCEIVFCLIFVVEISLRILVNRALYFTLSGWEWNIFDCTVVGLQLLEEILRMIASGLSDLRTSISFMRILRVLRFVQVVRAIRILRFIGHLRTLVSCIGHSLKCLGWTLLLFTLVIYMVGVWLTQIVSEFRTRTSEPHKGLQQYYGSLGASVLLLFQSVTGGIDWDNAVSPLMESISSWMVLFYGLYIAFVVLAMMNVITGTFVEDALRSAKDDKDYFMINNVRELFNGQEGGLEAGALTWDDFESQLDKPQMREYFRAIDVDPSEARGVFKLLDLDGSGSINAEEFLSGCLGLRGPAKALDLALLMHEVRHLGRWLHILARHVEETADAACSGTKSDAAPKDDEFGPTSSLPLRQQQQQAGLRLAARTPQSDSTIRSLR